MHTPTCPICGSPLAEGIPGGWCTGRYKKNVLCNFTIGDGEPMEEAIARYHQEEAARQHAAKVHAALPLAHMLVVEAESYGLHIEYLLELVRKRLRSIVLTEAAVHSLCARLRLRDQPPTGDKSSE